MYLRVHESELLVVEDRLSELWIGKRVSKHVMRAMSDGVVGHRALSVADRAVSTADRASAARNRALSDADRAVNAVDRALMGKD